MSGIYEMKITVSDDGEGKRITVSENGSAILREPFPVDLPVRGFAGIDTFIPDNGNPPVPVLKVTIQ